MSLSRPLYNLVGFYFEELFNHPIRTKAITSGLITTSANYCSQKIIGNKRINSNSLTAYGIYGLLFGGTVPHYFYLFLENFLPDNKSKRYLQFMAERLLFMPAFTLFSLYVLSRLEFTNHETTVDNITRLYKSMIKANWTLLSVPVFVNFAFVPPMLRVFVSSVIGFFWIIFLAIKRNKATQKRDAAKQN